MQSTLVFSKVSLQSYSSVRLVASTFTESLHFHTIDSYTIPSLHRFFKIILTNTRILVALSITFSSAIPATACEEVRYPHMATSCYLMVL